MAPYSRIFLDDYEIYDEVRDFNPSTLTFFRESDKVFRQADLPVNDDDPPVCELRYEIEIQKLRDRLDVAGISLDASRTRFNEGLAGYRQYVNNVYERWIKAKPRLLSAEVRNVDDELTLLQQITFERWLAFLRLVIRRKPKGSSIFDKKTRRWKPTKRFVLAGAGPSIMGYPDNDFRYFARALVEVAHPSSKLICDLSELINEDYFESDQPFIEIAQHEVDDQHSLSQRTIILTEGSTDSRWIYESMKLLAPHIVDYFYFMDFEVARSAGGASAVVSTLKSFIGAGITNRIIALLDNDSAASSALRGLKDVILPSNVRVIQLPNIDIGKRYPTYGPSGIAHMSVNGLAGSLELYFGRDVLADQDGELMPIQWRGYDEALRQYQGELMRKPELQQRFEKKLIICAKNRALISTLDWSGMSAVVGAIQRAFV